MELFGGYLDKIANFVCVRDGKIEEELEAKLLQLDEECRKHCKCGESFETRIGETLVDVSNWENYNKLQLTIEHKRQKITLEIFGFTKDWLEKLKPYKNGDAFISAETSSFEGGNLDILRLKIEDKDEDTKLVHIAKIARIKNRYYLYVSHTIRYIGRFCSDDGSTNWYPVEFNQLAELANEPLCNKA